MVQYLRGIFLTIFSNTLRIHMLDLGDYNVFFKSLVCHCMENIHHLIGHKKGELNKAFEKILKDECMRNTDKKDKEFINHKWNEFTTDLSELIESAKKHLGIFSHRAKHYFEGDIINKDALYLEALLSYVCVFVLDVCTVGGDSIKFKSYLKLSNNEGEKFFKKFFEDFRCIFAFLFKYFYVTKISKVIDNLKGLNLRNGEEAAILRLMLEKKELPYMGLILYTFQRFEMYKGVDKRIAKTFKNLYAVLSKCSNCVVHEVYDYLIPRADFEVINAIVEGDVFLSNSKPPSTHLRFGHNDFCICQEKIVSCFRRFVSG